MDTRRPALRALKVEPPAARLTRDEPMREPAQAAHPPQRILLATPWDQPFGGVASVVGNLATHLEERGDSVLFLHLGQGRRLRPRRTSWGFPGYMIELPDARPPAHPVRGLVRFALALPMVAVRLARLLRKHRIQVVNIHYPVHEFLPLALCCRLLRVRLVTSVHGSDFIGADGRPRRSGWPLRWLVRMSDLVVAPSESCRGHVVQAFPGVAARSIRIPNGLDAAAVAALEALPTSRPASTFVLCIATLAAHKGIDVLLRAFAALAPSRPDLRLALLGDGPARAEMVALADSLGIAGRVEFLGERGRPEVARLLRDCVFLVLPSRAEAFGLVLLEAMAAQRAIVASAAGGIPEVIQDGVTGLLVPPGDDGALARAMQRLLLEPMLRDRLARNGKRAVRTRFHSATTGEHYGHWFRTLLGAAREPDSPPQGTQRQASAASPREVGSVLLAAAASQREAGSKLALAAGAPGWTLDFVQPPDWDLSVAECGGGFFHTSAGIDWGAPGGEPVFARLWSRGRVVGTALGALARCRMGRGAAHVRFPGAPAILPEFATPGVVTELTRTLAAASAAEVEVHGFDGDADIAAAEPGSRPGRLRYEYRLHLSGDPDVLLRRCSGTQRRHIQRGVREEWSFRALEGTEAEAVLEQASAAFAERRRWTPSVSSSAGSGSAGSSASGFGTATLAAFDGDQPLAVVVAGWGHGRAFYLRGGSTAEGYRRSAAAWLQWRVMEWLWSNGMVEYNLGGAPAAALDPQHPEHGLHRFKSGFGTDLVACRGATWRLQPAHLALHRVVAWARHQVTRRP